MMRVDQYANAAGPRTVPIRPGTDSYPVLAKLVRLDGEEMCTPVTVVRHARACDVPDRGHADVTQPERLHPSRGQLHMAVNATCNAPATGDANSATNQVRLNCVYVII